MSNHNPNLRRRREGVTAEDILMARINIALLGNNYSHSGLPLGYLMGTGSRKSSSKYGQKLNDL
jgi:hypothetical protein